ncbi:hypothetical protein E2562_038777 [Oryza meyeriana var. granulata]|uniref:ZF-HD dimerization-type domain-containing protein n=1 Tax=Oryza meyeriana var. granulata TaxID=110450 RepID=A0A6G1CYF8_9ORYZ|nr:hypothetical protein E2562_038777 [Oryza meyeriana var. granulata]
MPLNMIHTSESDEMDGGGGGAMGGGGRGGSSSSSKKRFRTKFTAEQKARMLDFAERVGWRLQKLDDAMVQHFCKEIGVKRRVLKVWMHNNKHNLAKKPLPTSPPQQQPMPMAMPPSHQPATSTPPPPTTARRRTPSPAAAPRARARRSNSGSRDVGVQGGREACGKVIQIWLMHKPRSAMQYGSGAPEGGIEAY